jgi:hypothetical protein
VSVEDEAERRPPRHGRIGARDQDQISDIAGGDENCCR